MPLVVERRLDPPLALPVYATNSDAVKGANAVTKERPLCKGAQAALPLAIALAWASGAVLGCQAASPAHAWRPPLCTHGVPRAACTPLASGERAAFFLGPPPEDKLPKDATPGAPGCCVACCRRCLRVALCVVRLPLLPLPRPSCLLQSSPACACTRRAAGRVLVGPLTLGLSADGNGGGNGGKAAPAAAQVAYTVPPKKPEPPAPKDEAAVAGGEEGGASKKVEARLAEALRDAQVKLLKVSSGWAALTWRRCPGCCC